MMKKITNKICGKNDIKQPWYRAVVRRHGLSDQISMVCTAREGTFIFSFEGKSGMTRS